MQELARRGALVDTEIQINGQPVWLHEAQLHRSLLNVLREDLGLTGTKEGCASGDCGACTVVACKPGGSVHTVNSCITPAGAYAGGGVLTVDGVAAPSNAGPGQLHPVQRAMIEEHGAQCGFCTPGFVMSMIGAQLMADDTSDLSHADACTQIGGNLCRCTGYRPILAALQSAWQTEDRSAANRRFAWLAEISHNSGNKETAAQPLSYAAPRNLQALREFLSAHSVGEVDYTIVAGSTDLWLRSSQLYEDFERILDISEVEELRQIERDDDTLRIGAAVTHAELNEYCRRDIDMPAVVDTLHRFGSKQIRARGTVGGNIANASPIADLPPMLLCLDAVVDIMGRDSQMRSVPLREFYQGYKQTSLQPGEVLTHVTVRLPDVPEQLQAMKISKREEDDISSVFGAFYLAVDDAGELVDVRIAYGGVAAVPVRLFDLEQALTGLALGSLDAAGIAAQSQQAALHVSPINDVRATAEYREHMVVSLLSKALQQAQASFQGVTLLELTDVE
jgi:xanthine dehydrogenase small subunit